MIADLRVGNNRISMVETKLCRIFVLLTLLPLQLEVHTPKGLYGVTLGEIRVKFSFYRQQNRLLIDNFIPVR